MDVRATLETEEGDSVGPKEVPFVWHPGIYHYGCNLELPGEGTYTITVEVDPPEWPRHDEQNGDRYVEGVAEQFEDVQIVTGQS